MHEIIEFFEEDSDEGEADICLIPKNSWISDEDSGDDECSDPNRLSKNQLNAPAALFVTSNDGEVVEIEDVVESSPSPPKNGERKVPLRKVPLRKVPLRKVPLRKRPLRESVK